MDRPRGRRRRRGDASKPRRRAERDAGGDRRRRRDPAQPEQRRARAGDRARLARLAAAVYAASEGLDVETVEAVSTGGQAGTASRIENYLGFPAGISGTELTQRASVQAIKFGARLAVPARAVALRSGGGRHEIRL
jgi:hypothetical protein